MKKFISLFLSTLLTGVIVCSSDSNADTQAQAQAKADPSPRYIAVSDAEMTWHQARDWCAARGGRLPLINNAESLGRDVVFGTKGTVTIDGVGRVNVGPIREEFTTSWDDTGLPGSYYWTGTVNADSPGLSWHFINDDIYVYVYYYGQGDVLRVVCVP